MADGKRCKTCGWQEATHDVVFSDLLDVAKVDNIELPKGIRFWGKIKIREYIKSLGVNPKDVDQRIYDIIRCSGFSTTRKPRKNWRTFAKNY